VLLQFKDLLQYAGSQFSVCDLKKWTFESSQER